MIQTADKNDFIWTDLTRNDANRNNTQAEKIGGIVIIQITGYFAKALNANATADIVTVPEGFKPRVSRISLGCTWSYADPVIKPIRFVVSPSGEISIMGDTIGIPVNGYFNGNIAYASE